MTARSHERRIPFATIFLTVAAALPSRTSGQDVAGGNLRDDWIEVRGAIVVLA
jgi:hypothetical protein